MAVISWGEVLAVNTLGVLYILEKGDTVHSMAQPASRDRDRAAVRSRDRVRFMVIILSVEVFCRGRRLGGPGRQRL